MVSPSTSSQRSPSAERSTDIVRRSAPRARCSSVSGQNRVASVARRCGCSDTARYASSAVALRVSVWTGARPTATDGAPSSVITSCGIARSIHTPSRGRNAFGTPLEQTPPHEAVRGVTRSRVVAWALATATFVLIVVGGVFQLLDGGATRSGFGPLWPNLLSDLALLATGAIALVLTVRRASNPVGWVLSASALIGVISLAASGYATYGIRIHPGALAATEWGAWIGNWIGRVTSGFFLLAFLLFPTGRLVSRRWRPALVLPVLVTVGFALRAFVPGPMNFLGVVNPVGVSWIPRSVDDGGLGGIWLLPGSIVAFASLTLRYRRAGTTEREQIKWLVLPVVALFLAVLTTVLAFA